MTDPDPDPILTPAELEQIANDSFEPVDNGHRFTGDDLDRAKSKKAKKRKNGSLPLLSADADIGQLRDFLTLAFRPPDGWRLVDFERGSLDDLRQPCWLIVANGRERRRFRFRSQTDFATPSKLRMAADAISGGWLSVPKLTIDEVADVWHAACSIARVIATQSEPDQAREWLTRFMDATAVLEGFTLNAGADRKDALQALRRRGEFTYLDARVVLKDSESPWPRRPVALIDRITGDHWIRHREAAVFLRYILDVKPLGDMTLTVRWREIGVHRHNFEESRPHLRASLYRIERGEKSENP